MKVREKRKLERSDLKAMNLPGEHWTVKFDLIQPKVKDQIENYLSKIDEAFSRGVGLVLMGPPGVGKTGIASVIAKEARARRYTTYFTTFWQLREDIRDERPYNDTESVFARARNVELLILDNLRVEDAVEKFYLPLRAIEEILAQRRANKLVTIVTTRLTVAELRQHMPGFADAIQGSLLVVGVEGENLREKQNKTLANEFLSKK